MSDPTPLPAPAQQPQPDPAREARALAFADWFSRVEFVLPGAGNDMREAFYAGFAAQSERAERAEEMVRAWQGIVESICAHIQDRIAMKDAADPERYLKIIVADVGNAMRESEQMLASRWHNYSTLTATLNTLRAENARLREALEQLAQGPDCGCVPCTGQCRSKDSLEAEIEERCWFARDALASTSEPQLKTEGGR